ncbi:MAG: CBS domain-containing protein [Clostridiaceae bacterium]|nr:CBS domain-containing protein [Clostridiaceae bacterium]
MIIIDLGGIIIYREKSNAEKFLAIYNELDTYMRRELNVDSWISHKDLIRRLAEKGNLLIKYNADDLMTFAELRNAIVHNPYKNQLDPIAEPHSIILSRYENLRNKILKPPLALDTIAIKYKDIYKATLEENTLTVMETMSKKSFTHVPVIEDGKLIGVFSENTIFSFIVNNRNVIIDDEFKIKDFIDFIPINNHCSECFLFRPRNITVIEIVEVFKNDLIGSKRIAAVFITNNGREDEKILGLITPWDVITVK